MKKNFTDYLEGIQSSSGIMKKAYNTAESELPDFLSENEKEINLSNRKLKSSDLKKLFNKVENPDKVIELNLYNNELTDISEIKRFKNLERLYINNNKITDISALEDLTKLKTLDIGYNKITNILALENLIRLDVLDIGYNKITNISSLKNLIRLNFLNIGYNNIKDISVLENLTKLKELGINYLKLKSDQIEYINSLKNLKELYSYKGFENTFILEQVNKGIKVIA